MRCFLKMPIAPNLIGRKRSWLERPFSLLCYSWSTSYGTERGVALKDVFQAIALGTPFIFAMATYRLFYWLDQNSSVQATREIFEVVDWPTL